MLALRYQGPEQLLHLETITMPKILAENHVLIEVKAASICHTENHFADGTLNLGNWYLNIINTRKIKI